MTTVSPAPPDFASMLADAAEAIRQEVIPAVRAEQFRVLWRKARAAVRANGGQYDAGTTAAIRSAFPEFAHLIPGDGMYHADSEAPAELTVTLAGQTHTIPAPIPVDQEEADEDEDEEEESCECYDSDTTARCVNCDGYPYARCDHNLECGDCGQSVTQCRDCDLDTEGCDHEWQCDECERTGLVLHGTVMG